jgi:hypothetical protein
MNDQAYEFVLRLAVEEAQAVINDHGEDIKKDEGKFHDLLFSRVVTGVDNSDYALLDAREISEVCGEVESDVLHGDILGL